MRQRAAILVLALVLFASSACSKGLSTNSPSETVVAFIMAGNEGKYLETVSYFESEYVNAIKSDYDDLNATEADSALRDDWKALWDEYTENGTIDRIEVLREEIGHDEATVWYRLHFKDGSLREDEADLIKECGVWKYTFTLFG
jgi:hypothetical protein